jgi:hypothetical protein
MKERKKKKSQAKFWHFQFLMELIILNAQGRPEQEGITGTKKNKKEKKKNYNKN